MYSVAVVFGPTATMWVFLFKNKDSAETAANLLGYDGDDPAVPVTITDDFGQSAVINPASIHAFMLEDMTESAEGAIARGIHQAKTQARGNQLASADPELRAAVNRQQLLQPGAFPRA